jgi:tetratricopeptide (TPR) repeat protein
MQLSAETLKENGNKAFASKDFSMALHWYNLAIDVDSIYCEIENKLATTPFAAPYSCTNRYCRPSSLGHILCSNRSTTHYHLKDYESALTDADNAINLAPSWSKVSALHALFSKNFLVCTKPKLTSPLRRGICVKELHWKPWERQKKRSFIMRSRQNWKIKQQSDPVSII